MSELTENERKWSAALFSQESELACERLLSEGFDVNCDIGMTNTPLMHAASKGDLEVCKLLVAAGADVDAGNHDNRTSLHLAAIGGHAEVVRFLIEKGASVEAATITDGVMPLFWAAHNSATVEVLLAAGASVSVVTPSGLTPLREAVELQNLAVCAKLLDAGADPMFRPNQCERDYLSPLEKAVQIGDAEVVRLLCKFCEVDPEAKTVAGFPLLELAGVRAKEDFGQLFRGLAAERAVAAAMNEVHESSAVSESPSRRSGQAPSL